MSSTIKQDRPEASFTIHDFTVRLTNPVWTSATGSFKKRELILSNEDAKFPSVVAVQLTQERVGIPEQIGLEPGDRVDVTGFVRGREYNGRYFTDLVATRVQITAKKPSVEPAPAADSMADNLPF